MKKPLGKELRKALLKTLPDDSSAAVLVDGRLLFKSKITFEETASRLAGREFKIVVAPRMLDRLDALVPADKMLVGDPHVGIAETIISNLTAPPAIVITGRRPGFLKKLLKAGAKPMLLAHFKKGSDADEDENEERGKVVPAVAASEEFDYHNLNFAPSVTVEPYLGEEFEKLDDLNMQAAALSFEESDSDSDEDDD